MVIGGGGGGGRGWAGGAVAHAVPCDDELNMQGNKYFLHRAQELSLGEVMHFTPTSLHRRQLILVCMVSSTIERGLLKIGGDVVWLILI